MGTWPGSPVTTLPASEAIKEPAGPAVTWPAGPATMKSVMLKDMTVSLPQRAVLGPRKTPWGIAAYIEYTLLKCGVKAGGEGIQGVVGEMTSFSGSMRKEKEAARSGGMKSLWSVSSLRADILFPEPKRKQKALFV